MLSGVLVSGGLKARLSQAYGRYSFRARVDADPSAATSAVVLTWPTSENWPAEGENDIYETTRADRFPFSSFIHYSPKNLQYWFHHDADGTQWHDMAMEWEPNEIRIYRDGALVFKVTDAYAIPDWAHNLTIQLDAVKPSMSGAVRMEVDDVRIYTRA
jgi:beta-glucanase (GH16 family)